MDPQLANSNLHFLIERAWNLLNMVNDEIDRESTLSFCRLCSENGHLCGITETPWQERQRLVAIRDSLKDVQHILEFLQRLQSCQKNNRHLALAKLEESRMALIDKVKEFKKIGRKLEVVEELYAHFANNVEDQRDDLKANRKNSWFLMRCLRSLFNPWVAIKLIVISISISSSYNFYKAGQAFKSLDLAKGGKQNLLVVAPNGSLNVTQGRG